MEGHMLLGLGLGEVSAQISHLTSQSFPTEVGSEWKESELPSTPPTLPLRPLLKHSIITLSGTHKFNGSFHDNAPRPRHP